MHSTRVYFNNIGSICTDSLRHGNGLSALLLLTRAAKSSAAKSSAAKTRSMENGQRGGKAASLHGKRATGGGQSFVFSRKSEGPGTSPTKD